MNEPTLSGGDGDVNQLFCFCGGVKRCAVRRKSPPRPRQLHGKFHRTVSHGVVQCALQVSYVVECNFMNSMMFGH